MGLRTHRYRSAKHLSWNPLLRSADSRAFCDYRVYLPGGGCKPQQRWPNSLKSGEIYDNYMYDANEYQIPLVASRRIELAEKQLAMLHDNNGLNTGQGITAEGKREEKLGNIAIEVPGL